VQSGKRSYPEEKNRPFHPEKKSDLRKGFLESALLPTLMRTEAEKSKDMVII